MRAPEPVSEQLATIACVAILLAACAFFFWSVQRAQRSCRARGGELVWTGSLYVCLAKGTVLP